ncbi:hypothetical protein C0J52_14512 [Blattella germanica]|nr:hypothetical protein C0J52_14512 [Blattella germanica]
MAIVTGKDVWWQTRRHSGDSHRSLKPPAAMSVKPTPLIDHPLSGDEVQRSLELLDRVLSEFDDLENGNTVGEEGAARSRAAVAEEVVAPGHVSSTPEDESPSLGGHQSEDDGYMSMNGRRAKFVLTPLLVENPEAIETSQKPISGTDLAYPRGSMLTRGCVCTPKGGLPKDFLSVAPIQYPYAKVVLVSEFPGICSLMVTLSCSSVSPGNSAKRSSVRKGRAFLSAMTLEDRQLRVTTATQTTLPKTRHQRPYGWETGTNVPPFHLQDPPPPQLRFGSLPYDGALQFARFPPPWLQRPGPLPPRTLPGAIERHREVRRRDEEPLRTLDELTDDDRANFSDDSLEELLPPPPTAASKRNSIAWEVPLTAEDADALLTPGSTKVVGRRRRRSGDHSSTGSIHRLRDHEEWPDPPVSTEDEAASPFSDSYYDSSATNEHDESNYLPTGLSSKNMTPNGTYVIRKGRKKERKPMGGVIQAPEIIEFTQQLKLGDLKRCSSTFDNIKSLLKEGLLEGLDEAPPDFSPPTPPALVRVVSLPSLSSEESHHREFSNGHRYHGREETHHRSKTDVHRLSRPQELAVTMEEEEDLPYAYIHDDKELTESDVNEEERRLIEQLEKQQLSTSSESIPMGDKPFPHELQLKKIITDCKSSHKREDDIDSHHHRNRKSSSSFDDVPEETEHRDSHRKKTRSKQRQRQATTVEMDAEWSTADELNSDIHPVPVVQKDEVNGTSESGEDIKGSSDILQLEFPPLPPSPVEEDDDEYSEIIHPSPAQTPKGKADTLPEPFYRSLEPPGSDPCGMRFLNRPCPPEPPPHNEPMSSLKTRSMDAGFSRGFRNHNSSSKREVPSERRTLPSELPGPLRRRTFQKRSAQSPREETLQTSCSLPETPIFARGCDIPRTPHRRAPDIPGMARTAPRPGGLATGGYRRVGTGPLAGHGTGVALGSGGLSQALVGAELLRLAGGPGRGWYPRHRQQTRPASIEHLDRLAPGHSPGHNTPSPWEARDSRKPLTLPPNLSPKFFHRSPREALRRVTSLLIRKGKAHTCLR